MNCIDTAAGPSYSSGEVLCVVRRCLPFGVLLALCDQRASDRILTMFDLSCVRLVYSGVGLLTASDLKIQAFSLKCASIGAYLKLPLSRL